jgi:salicylate hydroxylase
MRILISGGGIGGLTAALCLHDAGIGVDVHERSRMIGEVGAGLQLSPNAMQVFRRLGLEEAILAVSNTPQALVLRDGHSGAVRFSLPMADLARKRYGADYVHVHRADLIGILQSALQDRCPGALHVGDPVVSMRSADTGAIVQFANGKGVRVSAAVGADGVQSATRQTLFPDAAARYTGYAAWRLTLPREAIPFGLIPDAATVWTGSERHAVTYWLRQGREVNFVGVFRQSDWTHEDWSHEGDIADLRLAFADFAEPVRRLLSAAPRAFVWALRDRPVLPVWGKGQITLLGDAAHAMPPFFAQGAAQAIEDAWVLARCLKAGGSGSGALAPALRRYESLRGPRTQAVQQAAWRNVRLYHGEEGPLMRLGLRLAARFAPFLIRRQTDWIYRWKAEDAPR